MLRSEPRSAYLLFEDHPAPMVEYTDNLEIAKNIGTLNIK